MNNSNTRQAPIVITIVIMFLTIVGLVISGIVSIIALSNRDGAWLSEGFEGYTWNGGPTNNGATGVWCAGTIGDVYTCGSLSNSDLMLVRWSQEGEITWSRTWSGLSLGWRWDIWGDNSGSIYTCGEGNEDWVLVKWDGAGNILWTRTWGGYNIDRARSIWGDDNGHVYVCGIADDSSYYSGNPSMALVKWDSSGNMEWNRTWDSYGYGVDYGTAVWGNGAGNLFTCGITDSASLGTSVVFLAKWDEFGNLLWIHEKDSENFETYENIRGDDAGNIYLSGRASTITDSDAALMKWDAAGNILWTRTWNSGEWDEGHGLWVDGAGGIYTIGNAGQGNYKIFLNKWDASGYLMWQRMWQNGGSTIGYGISSNGAGNIFVTGYVWDPFLAESRLSLVKINVNTIQQVEVVLVVAMVGIIAAVIVVSVLLLFRVRMILTKKDREPPSVTVWRRHSDSERSRIPVASGSVIERPFKPLVKEMHMSKSSCPRCGNQLPVGTEKEKYCVFCGGTLNRS